MSFISEEVSTAMERPMSENKVTLDNLPDNMIHLGDSQFLVVRSYQGPTRIHIRKFVENEAKQLLPTKDGVSLTPRVWVTLTEKLPKLLSKRYFDRYPDNYVDVEERDLCIVKDTITDGSIEKINIMLQRMFQRKDKSLQFVPETIHLNEKQCYVLLSSTRRVKDLVKASLLTATLRHYVEKLLLQHASPEARAYTPHPYNIGLVETKDSLRKCFLEIISLKMKELAPCYGCEERPCICHTAEELVNMFFETALYEISYVELAQYFFERNVHHLYFFNLILHREFFTMIDVSAFLNEVKNMLLPPTDEVLCDMLEIC